MTQKIYLDDKDTIDLIYKSVLLTLILRIIMV